MANEEFKQRLREAYRRVGGQEAVEERSRIAQTTLSYWAGAAKKLPPPDRLAELAKACGVSVEWLLTGTQPAAKTIDERLLAVVIEELERHLARGGRSGRRRVMIPADKAAIAAKIYVVVADHEAQAPTPSSIGDIQILVANLLLQD